MMGFFLVAREVQGMGVLRPLVRLGVQPVKRCSDRHT